MPSGSTPVVPAVGRLRKEGCYDFNPSMDYIHRASSKPAWVTERDLFSNKIPQRVKNQKANPAPGSHHGRRNRVVPEF